jgi:hypothetical protein
VGVSGTPLRDGESSAFRIVCSCNPIVLDTPEESRAGQHEENHGWGGRQLPCRMLNQEVIKRGMTGQHSRLL